LALLKRQEILHILLEYRIGLIRSSLIITRDFHASEDIYQNLVMKSIEAENEFETSFSFLAWCKVVVRTDAIAWRKKVGRELVLEDYQIIDMIDRENLDDLASTAGLLKRLENLDDCMKKLNPDSIRLLNLRYQGNRKCKEVAQMTGDSLDSVYKRLSRIHMMLRDCLSARLNSSHPTGGLGHET